MVLSPKYSFVDFNDRLPNIVMPAIDSMAVAFQFYLSPDEHAPTSKTFGFGVVDEAGTSVLQAFTAPVLTCFWGIMTGIDFDTSFPLTVTSGPVPAVEYLTRDDLFLAMQLVGLQATGTTFLQCCDLSNVHNTAIGTSAGTITITFYAGVYQVTLPATGDAIFLANPVVLLGQCFRYYIDDGGTRILSNRFQRQITNDQFTWVTYSCNECAYTFYYSSLLNINQNWLPIYCLNPKYPETRKVYLKSNKKYKVLSAIIEKSREVVTDWIPELLHDRMAVMLAHDNIHFKNTVTDADVYKKDDYSIGPIDSIKGLPNAQATFTINEYFEGRNSNCDQRAICTSIIDGGGGGGGDCVPVTISGVFALPTATVGVAYLYIIPLLGTGPFAIVSNDLPSWMSVNLTGSSSSLLTFTGTPAEGDVVSGFASAVTVSNCSGANMLNLDSPVDVVIPALTANLDFSFFHSGSSFLSFSIALDVPIDADITVIRMFADGFIDCDGCNGIGPNTTAVASSQFNAVGGPLSILAGATGDSHDPESTTGDWAAANCVKVYNVLLNGSPVLDGDVVVIGTATVTIHIQNCT